ncbi:hypothetical protein [Clostridium manihotivorum]|uniref:Uncharacterized protein n=1 Tax=Clostridium manihotivorum TaxID=2320868 RepID=A0A3R5X1N8_9CLOT|nr:hypothetical protein [Clostridium manihotivorum]QAA32152.1 hypothetical protein C1I91_11085 [Clostridium manihotivorum]
MLYILGLTIYIVVIFLVSYMLYKSIIYKRYNSFETITEAQMLTPSLGQKVIYYMTLLQMLIIFIGLLIFDWFLVNFLQEKLIVPNNALLYLKTSESEIAVIAGIFIIIPLVGIIMMFFHSKDYDFVAIYKKLPTGTLQQNLVPLTSMLLICFILAFPFYILGMGDYVYFTDDYVAVDNFFTFSEKHYSYSEIKEIKTELTVNVHKNNYNFSYTILFKDKSSKSLPIDTSNDIIKAETILKSKNVKINHSKISKQVLEDIKSNYNKHITEIVENVYEVN